MRAVRRTEPSWCLIEASYLSFGLRLNFETSESLLAEAQKIDRMTLSTTQVALFVPSEYALVCKQAAPNKTHDELRRSRRDSKPLYRLEIV